MAGDIRYIKFGGGYDKFDYQKGKPKAIKITKGTLKYLTKEWETLNEEDTESDKDKLKIYEGNFKDWGLLIISLTDTPVGLVRQCYENEHEY